NVREFPSKRLSANYRQLGELTRINISIFFHSEITRRKAVRELSPIRRITAKRPHPPALPIIGTGILLKEKGSASAQAAAVDDFGRKVKFSSELSRMFFYVHMPSFIRR
ncbi:MAG: hypothetical protein PHY20_15290, partial [Bacteroidales bacterium]|nr:hypothetical protein [Bacteroidales bacterium]